MLKSFEKLVLMDVLVPIRDLASLFDKPEDASGLKHQVRLWQCCVAACRDVCPMKLQTRV